MSLPRAARPSCRLTAAVAAAALLLPPSVGSAQFFPPPGYGYAPPPGYGYRLPPGYGQFPPGYVPGFGYDPPPRASGRYAPPPPARRAAPAAAPTAARPIAGPAPIKADLPAEELRLSAEDPPVVVGRVARTSGTGGVSYRVAGEDEWQAAGPNTALVAGNGVWTEPGARAAVEAGQTRLFLDGTTAVQIETLDETGLRATLAQGAVFLRVRGMDEDGAGMVEVATPEAAFATAVDGRYLLEAAGPEDGRRGRVTVFEGAAEVTLPDGGEAIRLGPGEALVLIPGQPPARERAGAGTPLMAWALGTEARRPVPVAARGMTGIEDLSIAGRWDTSPEYADVWYPPVGQDWSPYSDGSWQWRDPWGWTWVDAAPWGFATSHYGRWVQIGPRWAWAPAPVPVFGFAGLRPVWAPALVAFFGGGGQGPGRWDRPVGWVPLGPREAWYPWYRASPGYLARVNLRQVPNLVAVRTFWNERGGRDYRWDARRDGAGPGGGPRFYDSLDDFRNRRAAVQVPERIMLGSLPVRGEARRVGAGRRDRDDRSVEFGGGLPLRPVADTRGVTGRSAERLGLRAEELRADGGADRAGRDRWRAEGPPDRARAALREAERRADGSGRRGDDAARLDGGGGRGRPAEEGARPDGGGRRADGAAPRRADELDAGRAEIGRRGEGPERGPAGPDKDPRLGGPDDAAGRALRPEQRPQDLRQRLLEDQARRQAQDPRGRWPTTADDARRLRPEGGRDPRRGDEASQQQQRLRDGPQDDQAFRRGEFDGRRGEDAVGRPRPDLRQRPEEDLARRRQEDGAARRQLPLDQGRLDQGRREELQRQSEQQRRRDQEQEVRRQQAEQGRRLQEDQARRQQEQEVRRQQAEGARRQQEEGVRRQQEQEVRRQQAEQVRRQQEDAARRQQQQDVQRQQMEQARRQQEAVQRRQMEQARRQQEEGARRQQMEAQRQQVEQVRRQQEEGARRQQMDQVRRQQEAQARQQQEAAQRQQMEQVRRQQQDAAQQQMRQQQRMERREERGR